MNTEMDGGSSVSRDATRKLAVLVILLASVAAISVVYMLRARERVTLLSADNQQMTSNLARMQGQLDSLTAKLNGLSTQQHPQIAPLSAKTAETSPQQRALNRTNAARRRAEEARWRKVQAQLADEQDQIATARQDLEKTRTDLEGDLKSSHDELNGSVAKNHDELVALEKRGERSYFEFDLAKGKEFKRIGPVSLSLRKTNTKHERYNVEVLVGDNQISKKDLNLYEPAFFYPEASHTALELVVNKIDRNEVHGYVSAPKYKESDLALSTQSAAPEAATGPKADVTPASGEEPLPHRPKTPQP
jgi:hypothetical protein